ncbi:MAG: hypothetical protein ABW167_12910 [Baekduia sp.]
MAATASASVTYPTLSQSPSSTQATLDAVSCASSRDCMAVGTSITGSGNEVTARAQATPSATFGTYTASGVYSGSPTRSSAAGVFCSGAGLANCNIVGWSIWASGPQRSNWSSVVNPSWAPAGAVTSRLRVVSDSATIAAGDYTDASSVTRAYVLVGAAATSAVPVTAPSSVSSMKCGANGGCTVIGSSNGTPYVKTFTITSDPFGQAIITWVTAPTVPAMTSLHTLKSITCADARCFIAGYFTVPATGKRPFLLESTNQGATFTTVTPPAMPAGATQVAYNGVSCANKYQCRIVGEVVNGGVTSPYTATFSAPLTDPSAAPAGTWTGQAQLKGTGVASAALNATSCATVGSGLTRTARCADVGTGTSTTSATIPVGAADILWTS